jgi:hypothetical protein
MPTHHQPNEKIGALFQAVTFSIAFICLALFFSVRYHIFITHDPLITLTPTQQSEKHVVVGLHVAHFSQFNIAQNKFVMDGTVWFLFDPKETSLDIIKKFNIFNGTIQHVSDAVIIDHNDSKIAQFRIRVEFHTPLNYRMFPLDDHRVNLIIYNRFLPDDVILQSNKNDITFADSMFLPGWKIVGHDIQTGIKELTLERDNKQYSDKQQEAIIAFDCERTDPSIMINILLTLLLMLFLAMLTFSSDEDSVLIVTVGIVALIGYRSVMQSMTPPQVSYFIYSDYMYLFALAGVIITLFGGIVTRDQSSSTFIKKCYIIGIYSFFVAACIISTLILS